MPRLPSRTALQVVASPDGSVAVLDTSHGRLFLLNPTAATVWIALGTHGGNVEDAARVLAQRHGQPFDRVLADTRRLMRRLVATRLLRAA